MFVKLNETQRQKRKRALRVASGWNPLVAFITNAVNPVIQLYKCQVLAEWFTQLSSLYWDLDLNSVQKKLQIEWTKRKLNAG